jgi:predicted amidohydrolase
MNGSFDVACLQAGPIGDDVAARRAEAVRLVESAAGAELIVLPELWPTGYFAFDDYRATAEALDGPTVTALAQAARNTGAHVVLGSFVEAGEDGLHNTTALLAPDGQVLASYRKMHVFGYGSREVELITGGRQPVTVATDLGVLGLAICYDLRFPELFRAMVDQGAEIFVVPAAWPGARTEHWRVMARARAIENQAYVIACNGAGVGTPGAAELAGHSAVIDPWGEIDAEAGPTPAILRAVVHRDRVAACRADFPALADRRLSARYEIATQPPEVMS